MQSLAQRAVRGSNQAGPALPDRLHLSNFHRFVRLPFANRRLGIGTRKTEKCKVLRLLGIGIASPERGSIRGGGGSPKPSALNSARVLSESARHLPITC